MVEKLAAKLAEGLADDLDDEVALGLDTMRTALISAEKPAGSVGVLHLDAGGTRL
jgi:hypothetical protein